MCPEGGGELKNDAGIAHDWGVAFVDHEKDDYQSDNETGTVCHRVTTRSNLNLMG
jgi:hypothetical protein